MTEYSRIVLGGGCFWCLEAVFQNLIGVEKVNSGYCGGNTEKPTYDQVCDGHTNHAEVIKIEYNPHAISLETIIKLFYSIHDPTTENRQGNDIGSQYRSIILANDQNELDTIKKYAKKMQEYFDKPIVTEFGILDIFYEAEEYHQNYFIKNPSNAYCQAIINPKLSKIRLQYKDLLKN